MNDDLYEELLNISRRIGNFRELASSESKQPLAVKVISRPDVAGLSLFGQIHEGGLVLTKKDMAKHWLDYSKLYITDNNLRTKGLTKIQKMHVESK